MKPDALEQWIATPLQLFGRSKIHWPDHECIFYAMSDIHGNASLLKKALSWIYEDFGQDGAEIIFCGDYIDYGPDASGVLDILIFEYEKSQQTHTFLLGNHEYLMINAFCSRDQRIMRSWQERGGAATLASYCISGDAKALDRDRLARHLSFLARMSLSLTDQHRIFVHAGIKDIGKGNYTLDRQNINDLLWISPEDMDRNWPSRLKKLVVHGHKPFDKGVAGKRVCLDGGAGMPGGALKVAKFVSSSREPVHIEPIY